MLDQLYDLARMFIPGPKICMINNAKPTDKSTEHPAAPNAQGDLDTCETSY